MTTMNNRILPFGFPISLASNTYKISYLLSRDVINLESGVEPEHLEEFAEERAFLPSNESAESATGDGMAGVEEGVEEAAGRQKGFQVDHQLQCPFAIVHRQHIRFA